MTPINELISLSDPAVPCVRRTSGGRRDSLGRKPGNERGGVRPGFLFHYRDIPLKNTHLCRWMKLSEGDLYVMLFTSVQFGGMKNDQANAVFHTHSLYFYKIHIYIL